MKKLIAFILFIPAFLLAVGEQPHHITAYIGEPNETDILVSYSRYTTNHFWNMEGKKLPTFNDFSSDSYLIYAEYALNSYNSFSLNGGYTTVSETVHKDSQGVEDFELGWKHLLHRDDTSALTARLLAIVPGGDRKSSIRYGQFGGQVQLLYSGLFTLLERYGWVDLGIAYRFYTGFPADQFRTEFALGYYLSSYIILIGSGHFDYGLNNGKTRFNENHIVLNPSYRLLELQLECLIKVCSKFSVTIGGFGNVWGRNVGCGGGVLGGTWFDF